MSDPTPVPTPTPDPKKKPGQRAPIKQEHLDELSKSSEIVTFALDAENAPRFAKYKVMVADLTNFDLKIKAAKKTAGIAIGKTTDKESDTGDETEHKNTLIKRIQAVQKSAKLKTTQTGDQNWVKRYVVGDKFYSSRSLLEQTAENFIATAVADDLPGIGQEEVEAIQTALDAYSGIQTDQTDDQGEATGSRATLDEQIAEIARSRRIVQLAADSIWPADDKKNAGMRMKFKLPPDKSLK